MKSRTVLITGATAGIGRSTALRLARAGHRVFATGRRKAALESLVKEAKGTTLEVLELDVTNADSIARAKEEILRKTDGHGVDVLVNNAGYGLVGPLEEIGDAELRAQYETNVFGLMAMTRTFLPKMRERGFGRIINVSSMGGRVTFPFMGAYNSTKYAVESLSDALRVEVAPFGIGVVLIEPGAIHTEFADVALGTSEKYRGSVYEPVLAKADDMRKQFDATAVGPEHVARAIQRAVDSRSPSARYVVPFRTIFGLLAFRLLPTRLMDAFFKMAMGLTKKRMGLPALAQST